MKLKIDKKIEAGTYKVEITAVNFDPDEQLKISKFGSPPISVAPKSIPSRYSSVPIRSLPVHSINHIFTFNSEEEADQFVESMRTRIKEAMEELRKKEDKFSENKEYDI